MEFNPAPTIRGDAPGKAGGPVCRIMEAMHDTGIEPMLEKHEATSSRPARAGYSAQRTGRAPSGTTSAPGAMPTR